MNKELERWPFDSRDEGVQKNRSSVVSQLNKVMEIEESIWRQRSRVNWLQEGDRNTKFFHGYAKGRGNRNRVSGVHNNNGIWCEADNEIQTAFQDHFSQLFRTEGCNHVELVIVAIPRKVRASPPVG